MLSLQADIAKYFLVTALLWSVYSILIVTNVDLLLYTDLKSRQIQSHPSGFFTINKLLTLSVGSYCFITVPDWAIVSGAVSKQNLYKSGTHLGVYITGFIVGSIVIFYSF